MKSNENQSQRFIYIRSTRQKVSVTQMHSSRTSTMKTVEFVNVNNTTTAACALRNSSGPAMAIVLYVSTTQQEIFLNRNL